MLVSPSILSANFLKLGEDILSVSSSDMLHIDVMDGHFVPNMTIGPLVCENIHTITNLPLDVHLMVENTDFFIDLFAPLKPKFISVHLTNATHLHRSLQKIRSLGISPSVVLNPHEDPSALEYILPELDMVLLMSVNPGFGGQSFIESTFKKIAHLKEMTTRLNPKCLIEVDGGVNDTNIKALSELGVDVVVSGNYIFKAKDRKSAIKSLQIPAETSLR
ncbi:ribulose-phosphate 3-epimerase [Helicobacter sp. 13S00401-1]|uniref:ribulose-phosphate 3-epimerase n=1 Tax=Helicobacter sp. 13S00401-1 TaxID=1905758 RepID=UPI000BA6B97A|nr:ribulose-phosphate 3-epimerase [Helicobacter sp. 13S00401-1]PAF51232.1 ribulose-phosphate 3-epimerase [Helicobacter sp. 13S00401-1]